MLYLYIYTEAAFLLTYQPQIRTTDLTYFIHLVGFKKERIRNGIYLASQIVVQST